ncbi:MAG: hypothetical protein GYA57_00775 [Myxococcales bacterium]|nr:hypothetical protein [Myxococcales bacterium]
MSEKPDVTHENVLFPCGGGFANTGLIAYQAAFETVRELGLRKVSLGCLGSVPLGNEGVLKKSRAARRIVTVDGCANQCARKLVEAAGLPIHRAVELVRDVGTKKVPLSKDLEGDPPPVDAFLSRADVEALKKLLREALEG